MAQYCTISRRRWLVWALGLVVVGMAAERSQAFLSPAATKIFSCDEESKGWYKCTPPVRWTVSQMSGKEEDSESLFEEESEPAKELDVQEKTWRYANKPLLRIGVKGATSSHGNSLRQLLEDHTIVKVKVNTRPFDSSVEVASKTLLELAVNNGAPADMEIIQFREGSKEILFGLPGTLQRMEEGLEGVPNGSPQT